MFERYTEKARRVIFFGRYEASQVGSPFIEAEHLLLGLLREDKFLTRRFLRSDPSVESIRRQIEAHTQVQEKILTSVDIPLSNEGKRVLAFAAEEAERLGHKHIGTEHLLLGLLREEKSFAAELLHERGLRLSTVREELERTPNEQARALQRSKELSLISEFSRDLTQSAMDGGLDPLIGRAEEIGFLVEVLSNRTRNSAVLIGESGVGKTAIVEGLAQRIADGDVPSFLADKRVLALDLSLVVAGAKLGQFEERLKTIIRELIESQNAIIFVEDLHTLLGAGSGAAGIIIKPYLSRGEIQCITEATPSSYRTAIRTVPWFARYSRNINVLALNGPDTVKALVGLKERYEKFHAVSYSDEAVERAAEYSGGYISRAIDVLDSAGSRLKLRQTSLPDDVLEVQKRIKFIVHRMQNAIANHEFEKARFYSDEERKERENLRALREAYKLDEASSAVVSGDDIEKIITRIESIPLWFADDEDEGEINSVSTAKKPESEKAKTSERSSQQEQLSEIVNNLPVWDVFICHASEDKAAIARPLADALRNRGMKVWYDDFSLKLGDRLRQSIEFGLANSRYGVIVLSPNFFAKDWPTSELNGLAAREVKGKKVVLPIWYNIGFNEVQERSPTLAERVAARFDKGLDYVVGEIMKVLDDSVGS